MNEKLILEALHILEDRAEYWGSRSVGWYSDNSDEIAATARAVTYDTAVTILKYAIEGNAECLAQFNYKQEVELC